MKQNIDILHLFLVIAIGVCLYFITNENNIIVQPTEYIKGEDIVVEKTKIESVFVDRWLEKADTVNITDTSCFAQSDFNIEQDSVSVSGTVAFIDSVFDFGNVLVKYPEFTKTVTRVDTILKTVPLPFYKNSWFWGFLAVVFAVISALALSI